MGIENRIKALEAKRAAKDAQINLLLATSPSCDPLTISKLRKEKLFCKDEIVRLKNPQRRTAPKPPIANKKEQVKFLQLNESLVPVDEHASLPIQVQGIGMAA